jgi:hydroxyacylglutathione hydrolase
MKRVQVLEVGIFATNCYLYWDDATADGVIIDPGAGADAIGAAVHSCRIRPRAILLTHGHVDHIAAVAAMKSQFEIPLCIGHGEETMLADSSANISALVGQPLVVPPPYHLAADEELLTFGSLNFKVLFTPGHTPAGVCYLDESEGVLFCGDTLFHGSIGRTDFPGSSHELLMKSIEKRILTLPDRVICYPGHGPQTSVGAERVNNPFITGKYFA